MLLVYHLALPRIVPLYNTIVVQIVEFNPGLNLAQLMYYTLS